MSAPLSSEQWSALWAALRGLDHPARQRAAGQAAHLLHSASPQALLQPRTQAAHAELDALTVQLVPGLEAAEPGEQCRLTVPELQSVRLLV